MVKQVKTDAVWTQLDVDTLSDDLRSDWDTSKAAYKLAKEARQAFEAAMEAAMELPSGKQAIFGYNFGKLSVAIVEDDRSDKPKAKAAQSLAAFIASQVQAGSQH